jgi:hypothetical protein
MPVDNRDASDVGYPFEQCLRVALAVRTAGLDNDLAVHDCTGDHDKLERALVVEVITNLVPIVVQIAKQCPVRVRGETVALQSLKSRGAHAR